jgi:hypothetical protein
MLVVGNGTTTTKQLAGQLVALTVNQPTQPLVRSVVINTARRGSEEFGIAVRDWWTRVCGFPATLGERSHGCPLTKD